MLRTEAVRLAALCVCLSVFAAAGYAQTATTSTSTPQPADDRSIRPFTVTVSQAALDELRRRTSATRWPDKETVADQSQGAPLAKMQALVRY